MRHHSRFPWLTPLLGLALLASPLACGPAEIGELDAIDEEGLPNLDADTSRQPLAACHSDDRPPARAFGGGIEGYAGSSGQSRCDPDPKPGVVAFMKLVLDTYPCTRSGGIARACSVGDQSEHKEGRAWDWMVSSTSPAADSLLHWLLAKDPGGHDDAMARRLGIMYMIYNRKIWKAYDARAGWRPYTGSNPHTDHVHFSFSWAGAGKKTSYWDAPLNHLPRGSVQSASCSAGVSGWSQDPDQPQHSVHVELRVADKTFSTVAGEYRSELCSKLGACHHGFTAPIPPALRDGVLHHARAFAIDTETREESELEGGPVDFKCP